MSSATKLTAIVLLAACASPPQDSTQPPEATASWEEGTYEYVPPQQGQSMIAGGRFVFLYGPIDGSGPMTGEAGTYVVSGDTVTNTVTYSTNPAAVGGGYRWVVESTSGDTVTFVTMTLGGEITGRGRSVRVR